MCVQQRIILEEAEACCFFIFSLFHHALGNPSFFQSPSPLVSIISLPVMSSSSSSSSQNESFKRCETCTGNTLATHCIQTITGHTYRCTRCFNKSIADRDLSLPQCRNAGCRSMATECSLGSGGGEQYVCPIYCKEHMEMKYKIVCCSHADVHQANRQCCQSCWSLAATHKSTSKDSIVSLSCTSCFNKMLTAKQVKLPKCQSGGCNSPATECADDGIYATPRICKACLDAQFVKNGYGCTNLNCSHHDIVHHDIVKPVSSALTPTSALPSTTALSALFCKACTVHPAIHTFKGALHHCDLCRTKLIHENLPACSLCGNETKNKATKILDSKPYCCADCLVESTK